MNNRVPTNALIKFVCDQCGRLNEIEGSYDQKTFNLRFKHAHCDHCGYQRGPQEVPSGCFRCRKCKVIWVKRKHWTPVDGMDMGCYMRIYRAKKKNKTV